MFYIISKYNKTIIFLSSLSICSYASEKDNFNNSIIIVESEIKDRNKEDIEKKTFEIPLTERIDSLRKNIDEKQDVESMNSLANLYKEGKVTGSPDYKNAAKYFELAIDKGSHLEAMYSLAGLYANDLPQILGYDTDYDRLKFNGFVQAVSDSVSLIKKFIKWFPNHKKARKYYEMAIEKGHSEAMTDLAIMYEGGNISKSPDYTNAEKYYKMAIDIGNPRAMINLGLLLTCGKITPDFKRAQTYFEMAMEKEPAWAMSLLASMYRIGLITEIPDYEKAFDFHKKSALLGLERARKLFEKTCFTKVSTENRFLTKIDEETSINFVQELENNLTVLKETYTFFEGFFKGNYMDTIESSYLSDMSRTICTVASDILQNLSDIEKKPGYFITCATPQENYVNHMNCEKIEGCDYVSMQKSDVFENIKDLKVKISSLHEINSKSLEVFIKLLEKINKEEIDDNKFDLYCTDLLKISKVLDENLSNYLISLLDKSKKIDKTINFINENEEEKEIKKESEKEYLTQNQRIEIIISFLKKMNTDLMAHNEYFQTLEKNFGDWLKLSASKRNDLFLKEVFGK